MGGAVGGAPASGGAKPAGDRRDPRPGARPRPGLQVALASAKGSPGVTALALTLGLVWPQAVVVGELDPAGGDLAARLPLERSGGLAALAATARHGVDWEHLAEQLQPATESASLLIGPPDPVLSKGAVGILAAALPAVARSADVAGLWDLGRLDTASPAWPAVAECDLVAVVVRPTAGDLAHAVALLEQLAQHECPVGLVVASARRGRRSHRDGEVAAAVADRLGAPVSILGRIAFDPLGLAMAEHIMARWAGRCALGASVREVLGQVAQVGENGREGPGPLAADSGNASCSNGAPFPTPDKGVRR